MRSARTLHVDAQEALIGQKMAALVKAKDWELLHAVARLAQEDAPPVLAITDPALFQTLRKAVTQYHLAGWTRMTPQRVDKVTGFNAAAAE